MLKRKTGRYLLTLLVITGLAGTIESNVITKKERKYALTLMKSFREDALKSMKGLSEAQLNFKPSPGQWSIKECIYHIAATEKNLWRSFETAMNKAPEPDNGSGIKLADDQVIKMIENKSFGVITAEQVQPDNTKYTSPEQAINDFRLNRMTQIKYMKTSTEDLRNRTIQTAFGLIDCYQYYLFIAGYSNQFIQRIKEIKEAVGYPR